MRSGTCLPERTITLQGNLAAAHSTQGGAVAQDTIHATRAAFGLPDTPLSDQPNGPARNDEQ